MIETIDDYKSNQKEIVDKINEIVREVNWKLYPL